MNATSSLGLRLSRAWQASSSRPLLMWSSVGFLLLIGLLAMAAPSNRPGGGPPPLLFVSMPIVGAVALLALHAQSVFARPEACLTPGYRSAHLLITGCCVWLVATCGWLSMVVEAFSPPKAVSLLGAAAVIALLTATIVWGVHAKSSFAAILAVALVFSSYNPSVNAFWHDPAIGATFGRCVVLLTGLVGAAWWLASLWRLREESPRYHVPPIAASLGRASRSERAEQSKLTAAMTNQYALPAGLVDWRLDQFLKSNADPRRLLRIGFASQSAEVRSVWIAIVFSLIWAAMAYGSAVFGDTDDLQQARGITLFLFQPLLFACFMPGTLLAQFVSQRRPLMEQEVLFPLSREGFVDAFIAAGLRDVFFQTTGFVAVTLGLALWLAPEELTLSTMAVGITMAYLGGLLSGAVALLSGTWRLGVLQLFVPVPTALPTAAIFGLWIAKADEYGHGPFLSAAALVALAGWPLLRYTRHRWLTIDLG